MKITIKVPVREVKTNGMTTYEYEFRECDVVAVIRHQHCRDGGSGRVVAWSYMVDVVHPEIPPSRPNICGPTGGQYRAWVRRADHPDWKPPEGFPEGKPGCVLIKPSEVAA